jgi:hypothetical protein
VLVNQDFPKGNWQNVEHVGEAHDVFLLLRVKYLFHHKAALSVVTEEV